MPLADIVNVSITRDSFAPTQVGFGRLLILGKSNRYLNSDKIRVYEGLDGMLDDGFLTTDPEYIAAQNYFSQKKRPVDVAIGKCLSFVAQVDTINIVTVSNSVHYTCTVNGHAIDYTSDGSATYQEIAEGLAALITAIGSGLNVHIITATSTPWHTLTVTSDEAGVPITVTTADAKLSVTHSVANVGPQESLAAIVASSETLGNDWFGLMFTACTNFTIKECVVYCETRRKLFGFSTADTDVLANNAGNFVAALVTAGYAASWGFYDALAGGGTVYPEAAWFGQMLPYLPGEATWNMMGLEGVTPSNLTDTQRANLKALNLSWSETVAGKSVTQGGKVLEGEWVDIIVLADWTQQRIAEGIFELLASVPKVPFTDIGIAQVGNVVSGVLQQGVNNGGYAPRSSDGKAFIVTLPKASDFSSAERQTRNLTGVSFAAFESGAIHTAAITGDISA